MPREVATAVLARMRNRSDSLELPTGPVQAANGVPANVTGGRKLPYVQDYLPRPDVWPGWQPQQAACDEGLAIDFQPLVSADGMAVEASFAANRPDRAAGPGGAPGTGGRPSGGCPGAAAGSGADRRALSLAGDHMLMVGLGLVPWPVPAQNGAVPALLPESSGGTSWWSWSPGWPGPLGRRPHGRPADGPESVPWNMETA